MRRLRLGVIGGGVMGMNHCRILSEFGDVEFVGLADPDAGARERFQGNYDRRAHADPGSLLAEGLDGAIVAVPTAFHHAVTLEVIRRGIPVLVEKPLARSSREAVELVASAQAGGVTLMVGHIERFNPVVAAVREAVTGEELISIDITRVGPLPPRIKDVGVVTDLGVHDIDLIGYITGCSFARVHCVCSRNLSEFEDTAVMAFEMADGTVAHVTTNWLTPFKVRRISVSTHGKYVEGDLLAFRATEYGGYNAANQSYTVRELRVAPREPLREELRHFVEVIRTGCSPLVTGEDGIQTLKVVERCLVSSSLIRP